MRDKMRSWGHIGVLMGGCSSEREISLKSGRAIFLALKEHGCHVSALDIVSAQEEVLSFLKNSKIDVAFIALHGELGEDGVIQSILERIHIPYTGSGVRASQLAINKALTQNILRQNKIAVSPYDVLLKGNRVDTDAVLEKLESMPLVVKPASQGSSIGIALVEEKKDLKAAIHKAFEYDDEVLVERYIQGKELTVGILDKMPLPVIEIRPKNKFFDFEAKYQAGMTDYMIPAEISREVALRSQKMALNVHAVLGCCDLSRVDMMCDGHNNLYVLEINTIPGFTETSLLPKAAKAAGLNFTQLCLKLVALAYRKSKRPQASCV